MKTFGFLIIFSCFISVVQNAQSNEYICTKDVNINSTSTFYQAALIRSYFSGKSKFKCMRECNNNANCVSCTFHKDAISEDCFLFNRVFTSNDYSNANNVNLYTKKAYLTTTTTTTPSVIAQSISSADCNCSLFEYFQNSSLKSTLSTYNGGTAFNLILTSTSHLVINNKPFYFVSDYSANLVLKLNETWHTTTQVSISSARGVENGKDCVYVSGDSFYKLDYNLTILKSVTEGVIYNGIYYNSTDDTVFVVLWTTNRLDMYDSNLTRMWDISFGSSVPTTVAGYGGSLYVSCRVGLTTIAYVITNQQIVRSFPISTAKAIYIYTILIDNHGYMAMTYETDNIVNLFHVNGTDLQLSKSVPNNVYNVGFDVNKRLMITARVAIYFFN